MVKIPPAGAPPTLATEADLHLANLKGADLRGAELREANLMGANLRDANIHNADLAGATLGNAELIGVRGLTQEQLDQACGNGDTRLPEGFTISPCGKL